MQIETFSDLQLHPALLRAVEAEGYTIPTPIQIAAVPPLLARRDLLGCAQTGSGKTAAFALPMLQNLDSGGRPAPKSARALVLTPTRELAIQVEERFGAYGKGLRLSHAVIFGGVNQNPQVQALARGVDVLVATPGRLLDLMGQGHVRLDTVEIFVLDEADRMLDMGFLPDVRRVIAALPTRRQTLLFSATMPDDIAALAQRILNDPLRIAVDPVSTPVDRIRQRVLLVEKADKPALLADVLEGTEVARALVFTRTKHGANKVAKQLERTAVTAEAIHGNKSQGARQRALENFREGRTRVLVATDIAARGIDVEGITHVINYDLPNIPESYVHRIGRTARAGASGMAISFCDEEERLFLRDIERLMRQRVPIVEGHPYESRIPYVPPREPAAPRPQPQVQRRGQAQPGPRSAAPGPRPTHAGRPAPPQPAQPPRSADGQRREGGGRWQRRRGRPSAAAPASAT
jgi:ATP-dependent RNA helicase RhlE